MMKRNLGTSDFFSRQSSAKRESFWLVLAFIAGVIFTAFVIYCLFLWADKGGDAFSARNFWDGELLAWTFTGTFLFLGGMSFYKTLEMGSRSGADIAKDMHGQKVCAGTQDLAEIRLLNIVEEMALASGVPMPDVFVLCDEPGINAFAAGTRIDNAAVAVSKGALTKLSREELQAVIGHEFSHILNGDMRMNIRICGWIYGLVSLSFIGGFLLRISFLGRSKKSKGNILPFIGLGLYLIGIISGFFGQLIRAAISRQREHLADASSAQFTRNPMALANALSRIGGDVYGSKLQAERAPEYAHFFFASGVLSLFATHPPLEERIRLLNPSWDGVFLPPLNENSHGNEVRKTCAQEASVAFPRPIEQMLETSVGAKVLAILLMMSDNEEDNNEQASYLLRVETREVFETLKSSWGILDALSPQSRILLAQKAVKTLSKISEKEKKQLLLVLEHLAKIDGGISRFELGLLQIFGGM